MTPFYNLSELPPEQRKVYLHIIRQFARDSGAAAEWGTEKAEELIMQEIRAGRVKVFYNKAEGLLTLEVAE